MNNNKIMQIKDMKERFYTLRKEIIKDSCQEACENEINIYKSAIRILKRAGYNEEELGTKLISKLVTILYHERKMYRRKDLDKNYWNLDNLNNEHYKMLGVDFLYGINAMNESINNSGEKGITISVIAYELADYLGYINNRDERRERYAKMLKK